MATEQTFSRRGLVVTAGITGVTALTPALLAQLVTPLPASAASVDGPATLAPESETSGERSTLALNEPITAYHGVSGAIHQQRFNQLSAQGYRMISLTRIRG